MKYRYLISIICILLMGVISSFGQNNTITIPDVTVAKGKSISLPINMDNTADVVAIQFTLSVPNGLTLNTATTTLTDRSDEHSVTLQSVGNNKYMAMIFSSKNKAIKGRTGKLLSVALTASNSLEEGTEHQLVLSDVVIGAPDGSNLITGFSAGKVTIAKSPDLEVSHVVTEESNVNPGGKLNINWTVSNIGGLPTTGGWSEQILLANEQGATKLIGTLHHDEVLNAGGIVSRNAEFNIPTIIGMDGNCRIVVKLVPNSNAGEPSWLQENNVSQTANLIHLNKQLSLTPDNANVDEANAKTLRFQLSRSGNTTNDEVFALTRNADIRIVLPESITIEKGVSSTYFYAQVVSNNVLDNDSIVRFTVSGNDYSEISSNINIEDDTYPSLGISTTAQDVTEGGNIVFSVSTQRVSQSDIDVKMTCDFASHFKIPASIIIPAGQTSVEVNIEAVEDDIPNVEEVVTFTVTAAKHNSASVYTVLVDNDVPTLQLEITPTAVSEAAGPLAVTAKLRRIDNIDKVVTVKLSDDSEGGIYYGRQTIVLEKGIEEATVNLGPIDNSIVDGERTYNISAAVWIASCGCNANNGTSGGVVSVPLAVYDNDGPTLTMNSTASVLNEGSEMTITVKRNTSTTQQMEVYLSSNHDADIEYPHSVVIPKGESEVSFTVKSKGNEITGDGFTATLSVTADGFATGNIWFTVSDQTLPDAQIVDFKVSSDEVEAGGTLTVETTISNSGSYELPELTKVSIYTSKSSSPISTLYLQQALRVGEQIILTREITMPSSVGSFNVYAVVNDGNEIKELCYTNNNSKIHNVKTVSPYTFHVLSDKNVYKPGEKTVISGNIAGSDVEEKEIEVYVVNDNYRHTINAKTDSEGRFSVEYEPYSGQMGHFIAGACYPKEGLRTEMLAFDYYGVKRISNAAITCEALLGDSYIGRYAIFNPGNLPLTNVSVEVVSKPDNCDVTVNCPSSVSANSTFEVEYAIDATSVSEGNSWQQIELSLTTSEGVSLPTTLYYYCRNKQGQLKADVTRINTTMIKGASRDYPFTVTNIGKGETGKIMLELPSWMSSVTPREMSSLNSGESAIVILRLTPTETMQLNVPVSGSIGLNCANGQGLSLPFYIEPVSESTGTMIIDVCDENTYYTAEKPHVAGASVTVSHPTTGAIVTSGTTDDNGKFQAVLPEGYYAVSVSAPSHNSYRNNLLVDPGVENLTTVNLSIEAITVDWKVEETTVQDEYSIVTTVKYETNVPVPVVELSVPQRIEAKSLSAGESLIFYATLTNKGLITAEDVQFIAPDGFTNLLFEPLAYNDPFNLAPQQSVLIPVKVTHIANTQMRAKGRDANIDDDPCIGQPGTLYYWDCGNDRKWHRYGIAMQLGSCDSKDPSTWDNTGNGTYGGGGYGWGPLVGPSLGGGCYFGSSSNSSDISTSEDKGCEPCQNGILIAGLKCASHFVGDAVETLQSLMNLFTDNNNDDDDNDGDDDGDSPDGFDQLEGIYDLLENIASTFDACVNAQANFDGVYECYSSASQTVDQMFDDAVTTAFGHVIPADKLAKYKSVGKKILKWKKWVDIAADCANDFVHACDHLKDSVDNNSAKRMRAKTNSSKDYVNTVLDELDVIHTRLNAFSKINDIMWGSEKEWNDVSFEEMCVINDSINFIDNSFESIKKYKPEALSIQQFRDFYERRKQYLIGNVPDSVAETLNQNIVTMQSTRAHFAELGYYTPSEYAKENVAEMWRLVNEGQSSVCSSISLQFSQKLVLTRQAFRGTLTVFNGNETTAMTDVKLELIVKDESGNIATTHEFQINPETLTGFDGNLNFEDGWTLEAQQTGVATVMFIPTKYAAPTVERQYSFGGTLSYVDPFTGLTVTRDLFPVTLTVKPSPNLDLTYFMQRDIMGDDPLTEEIEPSEEAEFSLLINNKGYGDATEVKMFTEQPKIVDNEKGLMIDFELMSSQLNGGEKTLALGGTVATDFGTIPAKSTSYAQWWIKSSLLGHFTDYNVEATHVTSYGNPDLSLLNEVTIHELIRSLDIEDENSKLVGFMTNDIADAEDIPDMLYLSNGEIESVSLVQNININKVSDTDYSMTISTSQNGWNYGNIVDPTYGISSLKSVVRQSDGKEMSLRNFWQTDRTLRDGKDPLYENRIHFADNIMSANSETYILTFEPTPELLLEVASIEGVPEEGSLSVEPLNNIKVMFNKYIDPATFTTDDISLAVQGVKQDVSSVSVSTDDNKNFTLDFSVLNENIGNGYFVLTVNTSNVKDVEGYMGKNGKQAGWIMFRDGLVVLNATTYPTTAGTIQKLSESSNAKALSSILSGEDFTEYGSTVKMMTIPNEGYEFMNWTINGDVVSSDLNLEYVALEDMNIKANYAPKTYSVNITDSNEGGAITGAASGVYSYGDVLNLTAKSNEDYVFDGWEINNQNNGNDNEISIVVNESKDIKANFRRDVFLQSFSMSRGWNWISSYVNEPIPVSTFLGNVTHIVSQFDEVINDPLYGMIGGIETLMPGVSYKMDASYSSMKSFKGHLHDLASTPIELHTGWNWVSYPYVEEKEISDVLVNASEGDYMTSQFGFSEFADGYWEGTLNTLTPGYGYIYKSSTDKTLVFDFSNNESRAKAMRANNYIENSYSEEVDIRKYPSTMNIIARVSTGRENLDAYNCRIYAFAGNECRGESRTVGDNHYLTIYGDDATNITFVVENISNGDTYFAKEIVTFGQEVLGSRKAPFTITVSEVTGINSVTDSSRKMKVYSIEGVLINSEATAETLKKLSRGIYVIDGQKFMVK